MTAERDESKGLRRSQPNDDEGLFAWAIGMTTGWLLATGIPPAVAEEIQNGVYLDYSRFKSSINDARAFLLNRIEAAAEEYWETHGLDPKPGIQSQAPHPLDLIRARVALDVLTPAARRAVEMVFFEGRTYEEVAAELNVSVAYALRLTRKAVLKVDEWIACHWPPKQD